MRRDLLITSLFIAVIMLAIGFHNLSPTGLQVADTNHLPDWTGSTSYELNGSLTIDLAEEFFDVDFDNLTYRVGSADGLTATLDGTVVTVTADEGFHHATLTLSASDGQGITDADILFYAPEALSLPENTTPTNLTPETNNTNVTTNVNETIDLNVTLGVFNLTLENISITDKNGNALGSLALDDNGDGSYDLAFSIPHTGFGIAAPTPSATFSGLKSDLTAAVDVLPEANLSTMVFAAEPVTMRSATITLPKGGDVTDIVECPDFDFNTFTCPSSFLRTEIPFTDNGDTITFEVSHFSGYAGADFGTADVPVGAIAISNCTNLSSENYVLTGNVIGNRTCFQFKANNALLDCNGSTIVYDQAGAGEVAIFATQVNNITVRNCNIRDWNGSGTGARAINFSTVNDSLIFNNTIQTNGTGANNWGIVLQNKSANNTISSNFIRTQGTTNNYGIHLFTNITHANVTNNILIINGTNTNNAIRLDTIVSNSTVASNNITYLSGVGSSSYAIYVITASTNNNITDNTIKTNATSSTSALGIRVEAGSNYTFIARNNITTSTASSATDAYGIELITDVMYTNITDNVIFAGGAGNGEGVRLDTRVNYTSVRNNTIRTNSTAGGSNYGIELITSARWNNITGNTIITSGVSTANVGIRLETGTNNTLVSGNAINTSGTTTNYGIQLLTDAANNSIVSNVIQTGGTSSNEGIRLDGTTNPVVNNTIVNNTIFTNGTSTNNYGIRLTTNAHRNFFDSNIIQTNGSSTGNEGIHIDITSYNETFLNTRIRTVGTSSYGILIASSGNNSNFTNTVLDNTTAWIQTPSGANIAFTNTTFQMVRGSVQFPGNILLNRSYDITQQNLNITLNRTLLNMSSFDVLNTSATLTFNLSGSGFNTPTIGVNYTNGTSFTTCPASQCTTLDFSNSILTANVSFLSINSTNNATVLAAVEVSSCANVSSSFNLNNNVTTVGGCYNVTADNITFDCRGYTIAYDSGGGNASGISVTGRTNVTIQNCVLVDLNSSGVSVGMNITNTNGSVFTNNTVMGNSSVYGPALWLQGSYNDNFTFNNLTTVGVGPAIVINSSNTSWFNGTILNNPAQWINASAGTFTNFTNTTFATLNGSINLAGQFQLNGSQQITYQYVNVSLNRSFINSTNLSFLNLSATIVLANLGFNSPALYVDALGTGAFVACPASKCTSQSYAGGVETFNVSSFSAFATQEGSSSCGTIVSSTTLTQNVSSAGTCITFGANNLVLDCDGFAIYYGGGNNNISVGVNLTHRNNSIVKNCVIIRNGTTGSFMDGILLVNASYTTLQNNTIRTNGTSDNVGVLAANQIGSVKLVSYTSSPNSPTCNNDTGSLITCETCFSTPSVACNNMGGPCTGGKGFKTETVLSFNLTQNVTAASIELIGGEVVDCSLNGNLITGVFGDTIGGVSSCGYYTKRNVNPSFFFTNGTANNLSCAVAGSGKNSFNGFKLSSFVYDTATSTNNVSILDNVIVTDGGGSSHGISLSTFNSTVARNAITTKGTSQDFGIVLNNIAHDNSIQSNNITTLAEGSYGMYFYRSTGNAITNNTLNATGAAAYLDSAMNNLFNTSLFPGPRGLFIAEKDGFINYSATVNLSNQTNLSQVVSISYNRTFVNTTNLTGRPLNVSAQLTILGLAYRFLLAKAVVDTEDIGMFTSCTTPRCVGENFNRSTGVFYFNVTSFTTYSATEASTCADLDTFENTSGLTVTLLNNVSAEGTCFTISSDNITLDCAGYPVVFDTLGTGNDYGVSANNSVNELIKNCNIIDGNSGGASGVGIYFTNITGSRAFNNSIQTNGTSFNYGIYIDGFLSPSANNSVLNNTINTLGSADSNYGVHWRYDSHNISVIGNNVTTNGTSADHGVYNGVQSERSTIANNTVRTNSGSGIYIAGATSALSGILVQGNTITGNGSTGITLESATSDGVTVRDNQITLGPVPVRGIDAQGGSFSNVINNTVNVNGSSTSTLYGINWAGTDSNISGNRVTVTSAYSGMSDVILISDAHGRVTDNVLTGYGFITGVYSTSTSGAIANNTIYTNGSSSDIGIQLAGVNAVNSTIRNNTVNTTNIGIDFADNLTMNNTVEGNTIILRSGIANTGLHIAGSFNISVTNNTFLVEGAASSYGIWLASTARENTFFGNNISVNATGSYGIKLSETSTRNVFNRTTFSPVASDDMNWTISDGGEQNFTNTTFATPSGSITLNPQVNLSGSKTLNRAALTVSSNRARVNAASNAYLNKSATITLSSLAFFNPLPVVNYTDGTGFASCPTDTCTNTSYNGGTFTFNVSHWTTYAAQESPASCGTVTSSTGLSSDVLSNGTCFTVTASNVVIDCNGYAIIFDINGTGGDAGVLAEGRTNVTVQNCVIRDGNSSGALGIGINFTGTNSSVLNNNIIVTNGTSQDFGILLQRTVNNTLTSNVVTTIGAFSPAIVLISTNSSLMNATRLDSPVSWLNITASFLNNATDIAFNSTQGAIRLPRNLTLASTAEVTPAKLNVTFNNAFLNSTALSFLNTTGEVTLNGIIETTAQATVDLTDSGTFVNCTSSRCTNVSYDGSTYIYNVTSFTSYSSTDGSANTTASNTSCGNVFQSLNLTQDVSSADTCFTFAADNIVLDCQGHTITYAINRVGYGVFASVSRNVTTRNCTIIQSNASQNNAYGIYYVFTNSSFADANTINTSGAVSDGIKLEGGNGNVFTRNRINASSTTSAGINVHPSGLDLAYNNISDNNASGGSAGILLYSPNNSTVRNNYAIGGIGIELVFDADMNNLSNNTAMGGLWISESKYNRFWNDTVNGSTAIILLAGAMNNTFINETVLTSVDWINVSTNPNSTNTITNTYFVTNNGSVDFVSNITLPDAVVISREYLNVNVNQTYLNASNQSFMNTPAVIRLNLAGLGFTSPVPVIDADGDGIYTSCTADVCTSQGFTSSVLTFNVSHWTAYAAQEPAASNTSSSCANITSNTIMNTSVQSDGTCINITVDNVTLNCNGNTIYYDSAGIGGDGISANGRLNITIKNCIIQDINASGAGGIGINFTNTSVSSVLNSSVMTNGTSGDHALALDAGSNNNTFSNNTLATIGNVSYGVSIASSNGSQFTNMRLNNTVQWLSSGNFTLNNFTNTTFQTPNASIRFPNRFLLNGTRNVNRTAANADFNRARVNSSNLTFLNTSAFITFSNLTFTTPQMLMDTSDIGANTTCPADVCTNISYAGGIFSFNVSHWTTFTLQEAPIPPVYITNCTNLSGSAYYLLLNNVFSNQSCFGVYNDNLTLDCNGTLITYGIQQIGHGIFATSQHNITIKNCNITDGNGTHPLSSAINFSYVSNSTIFNNTVRPNGTTNSHGINLLASPNNTVDKNFVVTTGSIGYNHGIKMGSPYQRFSIVSPTGGINDPECTDNETGNVQNCKVCFTTPGVDCTYFRATECTHGKGYKFDTLVNFTLSSPATGGHIIVLGGEQLYCYVNDQQVIYVNGERPSRRTWYGRQKRSSYDRCGEYGSANIPGNYFVVGQNNLSCKVSGSGAGNFNGFKLSEFSYVAASPNTTSDNLLTNNVITAANGGNSSLALYVSDSSDRNIFANSSFNGSSLANNTAVRVEYAQKESFLNVSVNYTQTGIRLYNDINHFFNTTLGGEQPLALEVDDAMIEYINPLNLTNGTNLSVVVNLTLNGISVNTTHPYGAILNRPALLSFRNIYAMSIVPVYDASFGGTYIDCPVDRCTAQDFAGSVYTYNVTGFSNYSTRNVTDCGEFDIPGNYSISSNLTANDSCITIFTDNISIDCNGNHIEYAFGDPGYGIQIENSTNVTIRNCVIYQISAFADSPAILITNVSNVTFINDHIKTIGSNSNGMSARTTDILIVNGTTLNATGTNSTALWMVSTSNATLLDIRARTTSTGNAIRANNVTTARTQRVNASTNSSSIIAVNLTQTTDWLWQGGTINGTSVAVIITSSSNTNLSNITMPYNSGGTNSTPGVDVESSTNISLDRNRVTQISSAGMSSPAVYYLNTTFGTLSNNIVTTIAGDSDGIRLMRSTWLTLRANNVTPSAEGIWIEGDDFTHWSTHDVDGSNLIKGANVSYFGGVGSSPSCPTTVNGPLTTHLTLVNCSNTVINRVNATGTVSIINSNGSSIGNSTILQARNGFRVFWSSNITLQNSTITTNGTHNDYGLHVFRSRAISASFLNITTNGTDNTENHGIFVNDTNGSSISTSTLLLQGVSFNRGIYVLNSVQDNLDKANVTMNTSGTNNIGVIIVSGSNTTVSNGSVVMPGSTNEFGYVSINSTFIDIVRNNITFHTTTTANKGILLNASLARILSNTILMRGTSNNTGVYFENASYSIAGQNTIRFDNASGLTTFNFGVFVMTSNSTNLTGNDIRTNGTQRNHGIRIQGNVTNHLIENNTIFVFGILSVSDNHGIDIPFVVTHNNTINNTRIIGNYIIANGSGTNSGGTGIDLNHHAYNVTIANNTIQATSASDGSGSVGIGTAQIHRSIIQGNNISSGPPGDTSQSSSNRGIETSSVNWTVIDSNVIFTHGISSNFILDLDTFGQGSNFNNITRNILMSDGEDDNFGIDMFSSGDNNFNTIEYNRIWIINATDTSNYAIASLRNGDGNVIRLNNITTSGTDSNLGIHILGGRNTIIANNIIETCCTEFNPGINAPSGAKDNFIIENNSIAACCTLFQSGIILGSASNSTIRYNNITVGHDNNSEFNSVNDGIDVTGSSAYNITIAYNKIFANNSQFGTGIYVTTLNATIVYNNVTMESFADQNAGIGIGNGDGHGFNISNNNIVVRNGTNDNWGIVDYSTSRQNLIFNNNITVIGNNSRNIGIYEYYVAGAFGTSNVTDLLISNNTIFTRGEDNNWGIAFRTTGTGKNRIEGNNITTTGRNANHGIYFENGIENNTVFNNSIFTRATGSDNYGIYLWRNASNNNITQNRIDVNGTDRTAGVVIKATSYGNVVANNSILAGATGGGYGVRIEDVGNLNATSTLTLNYTSNNTVANNSIVISGNGSYGVAIVNATWNRITGNLISSNGTRGVGIFLGVNATNNSFELNNLTALGSMGYGIVFAEDVPGNRSLNESFEDLTLSSSNSSAAFNTSAAFPWSIKLRNATNGSVNSGNFSARVNGSLTPWTQSNLSLTADVPAGEYSIMFSTNYTEECPACADGPGAFTFWIDNNQQDEMEEPSGQRWITVQYPVPEGTHTFTWKYQRGSTQFASFAYVDDVRIISRNMSGGSNNTFLNTSVIATNTLFAGTTSANNTISDIILGTSNGSVKFGQGFLLPNMTNISSSRFYVNFSRVYLNSSNISYLNQSAPITLLNLNYTNLVIVSDVGDTGTNITCPSDICTNISNTSNGTLLFNVSHFTTFAAQENQGGAFVPNLSAVPITNCTNISGSDYYILLNNVFANTTCFGIQNSNVTLDCNGTSIFFDQAGQGNASGVLAINRVNVTVKNCFIQDINASGSFGTGISFNDTNESLVLNNTVLTNGTADDYGIVLQTAYHVSILQNTVRTQGSSNRNRGIFLNISGRNTLENNTVFTNGTGNNEGILLWAGSSNNSIRNNTVTTNGSSTGNVGIRLTIVNGNNNITDNRVQTAGTDDNYGLWLQTGSNMTLSTGNIIITRGTGGTNFGIAIFNSVSNIFINNTVTTTGAGSNSGVYTLGTADNNTFTDTIISSGATSTFNNGIEMTGGTGNTFNRTTISTTGTSDNRGVYIYTSASDNRFINTNITAAGSASPAIALETSANQFNNTVLLNTSVWINITGAMNNFTNTTFQTQNGSIRFPARIQINTTDITQNNLNITFNHAQLNATNISMLNASAFITLSGLTFSTPQLVVDYADLGTNTSCPSDVCTSISYSGGVETFNVSHWTTYAVQEFSNASIVNSTITNCALTNSTANNSIKTNCTVINSTNINCNVLNSTEINTLCIATNITNTTKINSTNINCTLVNSFENNTACVNSNKTNSIDINSNITNSTVSNSTITNCTVFSSVVNDSTKTNCNITGSVIVRSNNTNSTIINSNETNSTDINAFVNNSVITNSFKSNSNISNSTVTNSTIINCNVFNATVNSSTKTNCTIFNSTNNGCTVTNSTETSTTCTNSTKLNSTNTGCVLTGTFENSSTCTNSTKINSLVVGSSDTGCLVINTSETNVSCINSTKTFSIVINSTNVGCTVTNSTEIGTTCTNSNVTNSTKINSVNTNCSINASYENGTTCVNSTKTGSIDINSTITNSTITNSTIINCTVFSSVVNDSTKTNCNITSSIIIRSNNANSTIINSNETNSTDTNAFVNNSVIIGSTKVNANISNSTITNSTIINSTVTNSIINNSVKINSTIINSVIVNSNNSNSTIINSNETNSTDIGSTVINSTILNSFKNGSQINNSIITNSSLIGCIVINSTIIDSIKSNCTIINSVIIGSNNTNTTVLNSTERNSTDDDTFVINSSIILSTKLGDIINASNLTDSNVTASNITNSSIINSSVSNSTLTNCTVINSTIEDATFDGCSFIDTIYPLIFGVNITTSATSGSTTVGTPATYTITIGNNGTITATYNLTVQNLDNASTATLSAYNITVAPNSVGTVTLSVTDASNASVFTVTVTAFLSTNDTLNATTAVISTTVNPAPAGGGGGGGGGCNEAWACGAWDTCFNSIQTRTCVDSNGCGTTDNKPSEIQSCSACNPNWLCDDWSDCDNGIQTRDCIDANGCGSFTGQPALSQGCTESPEVQEPALLGNTAVRCAFLNRTLATNFRVERSGVNITSLIPQGYALAAPPFTLNCAGTVALTLQASDRFTDFKVLHCNKNTCALERISEVNLTALKCGNRTLRSRTTSGSSTETGVISPAQLSTAVSEFKPLTSSDDTITLRNYAFSAEGVKVRLAGLSYPLPYPKNQNLAILGTPLIVEFTDTLTRRVAGTVTLPVPQAKGIEPGSVQVYAFVNSTWTPVGGTQEGSSISVHIYDLRPYLVNKKLTLATVGVTCTACETAAFEREYSSPGTRTAIVLVHGAFSNKDTYNFMIDDFRATQQPFDVWTYDYPSNSSLDSLSTNLADAMLLQANRYDQFYIVGHSAGGLIVQQALATAWQRGDSTIPKVRRVVLVGSPTGGAPSIEVLSNLLNNILTQRAVRLFNLNSQLIQATVEGKDIPRVPGIDYQVIAGTHPYDFNLGLFQFSSQQFLQDTMKNDGVITIQSAQKVGSSRVNDLCKDYYEINLTHTDLIDNDISIRIVERIITDDVGGSTAEHPLLGQDQYVQVTVPDCVSGDQYALIGKPISDKERYDPSGCACGNGVCGVGENEQNCPSDCARIYTFEKFCFATPLALTLLLLALTTAAATFGIRHYLTKRKVNIRWLYAGSATVLVTLFLLGYLSHVCKFTNLLMVAALLLAAYFIAAIFVEKFHKHTVIGPPIVMPKPKKMPELREPLLKNVKKLLRRRKPEGSKATKEYLADLNRELERIRKDLKERKKYR